MHLLPSERTKRIKKAISTLEETGRLSIFEPCDCGSHVRHNNGGNYHDQIFLRLDSGQMFVKYETTCVLVPPSEWNGCKDAEDVIRNFSDWL